MSRYRITAADRVYAREFKRNLDAGNHFHSPGLQRILNLMRAGHKRGKYVLLVERPYERWVLGRMPGVRGAPVVSLGAYEFSDRSEAEWTVFRLRWQELTGETLEP